MATLPINDKTVHYIAIDNGETNERIIQMATEDVKDLTNPLYITIAAGLGLLDRLKELHVKGCAWNHFACARAAVGHHMECLKYLHENGCPWDRHTFIWPAEEGMIDVMEYAYQHGCPWDDSVTNAAAASGQLESLQWLHEHGCPWTHVAILNCRGKPYLKCARYLIENGCPINWGCYMDEWYRSFDDEFNKYMYDQWSLYCQATTK